MESLEVKTSGALWKRILTGALSLPATAALLSLCIVCIRLHAVFVGMLVYALVPIGVLIWALARRAPSKKGSLLVFAITFTALAFIVGGAFLWLITVALRNFT